MIFGKGQPKKPETSSPLTGEFTFGGMGNSNISEDVKIIEGGEKVLDWPNFSSNPSNNSSNQGAQQNYSNSGRAYEGDLKVEQANNPNYTQGTLSGFNRTENVPSGFAQTYNNYNKSESPTETPTEKTRDSWRDSYQKSPVVEAPSKKVSIAAGAPDNIEEEMKRRFGSEICSALGKGTIIEGSFCFDTPVCIDGTITGEIKASSVLIVGKNAVVKARIEVGSLIVFGSVTGDIKAEDLVEVKSTGILDGNLIAKRFVIEDGGWFKGNCRPTKERLDDDYLE